jgi:HEAT repeat protein
MADLARLLSSKNPTILDRSSSPTYLSPLQNQVDGHVGDFIDQATDAKTLSAMVGAGMAYRLTRLGTLAAASSLLPEGNTLASLFARGSSYALGLAGESATFAGMNRGFRLFEGRNPHESFGKEFLNSALSLGSLKFFGKLGEGQNLLFQHLLADSGMVASHHLAFLAHLEDKPEGDFFSQFLHAEAMNWQMKGSQTLLHGLSPNLFSTEQTLDRYLRNKETERFFQIHLPPSFSQVARAVNGEHRTFSMNPQEAYEWVNQMSSITGKNGGGSGKGPANENSHAENENTIRTERSGKEPDDLIKQDLFTSLQTAEANIKDIHFRLKDSDPEVHRQAKRDLAASIHYLMTGLKDSEPGIRGISVMLLGDLGANELITDFEIVSNLRDRLKDADPGVRSLAVLALGQLGATQCINEIKALLKDENSWVAQDTEKVLKSLGEKAQLELPGLRADLRSIDPSVRIYAARRLADLGENGEHVIRPLRGLIKYGRVEEWRVSAAEALLKIGTREALTELKGFQNSEDREVRKLAQDAVWRLEKLSEGGTSKTKANPGGGNGNGGPGTLSILGLGTGLATLFATQHAQASEGFSGLESSESIMIMALAVTVVGGLLAKGIYSHWRKSPDRLNLDILWREKNGHAREGLLLKDQKVLGLDLPMGSSLRFDKEGRLFEIQLGGEKKLFGFDFVRLDRLIFNDSRGLSEVTLAKDGIFQGHRYHARDTLEFDAEGKLKERIFAVIKRCKICR